MKKILMAASVSFLMMTGAHAQKSPFSYSHVQAGVAAGSLSVAGGSADTTAYGVGASVEIGGNAFLSGGYSGGQAKSGGLTLDQNNFSFGVGGHMPVSGQTDFVGGVSLIRAQASLLGYSAVSTGLGFDIGLRHALSEKLEIHGGVGFSVIGSDRVQTSAASFGIRYKFADKVSLGAGYGVASNSTASSGALSGAVRIDF